MRDKNKGLDISVPKTYYKDDNCENKPLLTWRSHANNFYTNWLNYYVYQNTPYLLNEIGFKTMQECTIPEDDME